MNIKTTMREFDIPKLFHEYSIHDRFYWYHIKEDKYVGMLDGPMNINYARPKQHIVNALCELHKDHVSNVLIFKESSTAGKPDPTVIVFVGAEWEAEWDKLLMTDR